MHDYRQGLSLGRLAEQLNVSVSGYYHWLKRPSATESADRARLKSLFSLHNGNAGAPMLCQDMKSEGFDISERTVGRRLKALGLKAKIAKKYKPQTDRSQQLTALPNHLNRGFKVQHPNQVWVTDITYLRTAEGWLYLCTYLDLFSRKIVGWQTSQRIDRHLVCDGLNDALRRRGNPQGVMIHSDQGSQYNSKDFRAMVLTSGCTQSMSRKGNCWDNAVAESWFHTMKSALINHEKRVDIQMMQSRLFEYIEVYYNRFRKHSTNGWVSPANYELQYYQPAIEGLAV